MDVSLDSRLSVGESQNNVPKIFVYLQVVARLPTLIYIIICMPTHNFLQCFVTFFLKSKSFASLSGNLDAPNAF